jgi:hypothetical protein
VPGRTFQRLIEAEPDIGEIIMRAFILRRVALMKHSQGGVVLIGSMHNADMLRLERFLSRNGYPHRTFDTEANEEGAGLLRCAGCRPGRAAGGGASRSRLPAPANQCRARRCAGADRDDRPGTGL